MNDCGSTQRVVYHSNIFYTRNIHKKAKKFNKMNKNLGALTLKIHFNLSTRSLVKQNYKTIIFNTYSMHIGHALNTHWTRIGHTSDTHQIQLDTIEHI